MNDMPGACQSRTVTEPQRERSRLKLDYSHQKRLLRLFDKHSEVFCEAALHKKCGVFFSVSKKHETFLIR